MSEQRTPRSRSEALARAVVADDFTRDGVRVRLASRRVLANGALEVRLISASDASGSLPIDARYLFVNPPTKVPDGTFRTETNPSTGESRQHPNYVDNPSAALHSIVAEAVRHYAQYGRPGNTTLTVFAGTEDAYIFSGSVNYGLARLGTGVIMTVQHDTDLIAGQFFSGNPVDPKYCYEAFIRFDTSPIPDGSTVDSVTLYLSIKNDNSATNFISEARLHVPGWGPTVDTGDWVSGDDLQFRTLLASIDSAAGFSAGYNAFTSTAAFATNVNKTGFTEMFLSSNRLRLANVPTESEYVSWSSADTVGTTDDPKLVVNYTEAVAVGRVIETDAANAVTPRKVAVVGQVTETQAANAVTRRTIVAVARATESDAATVIGHRRAQSINTSTEADAAQAVSRTNRRTLSRSDETDAASSISSRHAVTVDRTAETDAPSAVSGRKLRSFVRTNEADLANAIAPKKVRNVAQAVESNATQAVTARKIAVLAVGRTQEFDVVQPITARKVLAVGQATEGGAANALAARKVIVVTRATQTNVAGAFALIKRGAVSGVVEVDAPGVIRAMRHRSVGQTVETDLAQSVAYYKIRIVGRVAELDAAMSITPILGEVIPLPVVPVEGPPEPDVVVTTGSPVVVVEIDSDVVGVHRG